MRVGFFPGDNIDRRWGRDIHPWSALATGALEKEGCSITFLDRKALCSIPAVPEFDIIHLNWPQSLTQPDSFKRRKYMPANWYRRWFTGRVDTMMRNLARANITVAWQVHDLPYADDPETFELLKYVFDQFYIRADGLIFYEESAQPPVFELYGPPDGKVVGIAHLGEYSSMHGPAIERTVARDKIGIDEDKNVFLYAGTVRYSRNPTAFIERFIDVSSASDLLVVTGRGTDRIAESHSHERVMYKPGVIDHETFRDLICAANFVVNDAHRYLGSAIIRVALEYGVPVIASSFGCTSDLAAGAYIPIEDETDGLDKAIETALNMAPDQYRSLCENTHLRHRERPWSAYGKGCVDLYKRAIEHRG